MSVRGTTHARLSRKVIIREGEAEGDKIYCGWDICDKDGTMLHHVAINMAKPGFPRHLARYVFCTERHKQYFLNSHRPGQYGVLPGGFKGTIL